MKSLKNRPIWLYICVAAVVGIASGSLLSAQTLIYRIANGLFCGGGVVFLWGLFRLVRQLGFADAFLYSHQRMKRLSQKKKEDSVDEKSESQAAAAGSYFDYLQRKNTAKTYGTPIAIGLALIIVSFMFAAC